MNEAFSTRILLLPDRHKLAVYVFWTVLVGEGAACCCESLHLRVHLHKWLKGWKGANRFRIEPLSFNPDPGLSFSLNRLAGWSMSQSKDAKDRLRLEAMPYEDNRKYHTCCISKNTSKKQRIIVFIGGFSISLAEIIPKLTILENKLPFADFGPKAQTSVRQVY